MKTQPSATNSSQADSQASEGRTMYQEKLYQEGMVAGIIGAVTIAIWFLILDTVKGRPLYTPTVLGTVLFRRREGFASLENLPVSSEMVLMYTWVHGLVFCIIGMAASRLLALAEQNPDYGFGILLFFVIFEVGFLAIAMALADPVLQALAWPAVLLGNLLSAAAMGAYLLRKHPGILTKIRP